MLNAEQLLRPLCCESLDGVDELLVYLAFLAPGDAVMGMALPMGGHLTHGWSVSVTGRWFRPVRYGVSRDTGRTDLDEVRDLARRERPKVIFAGGTAIPRTTGSWLCGGHSAAGRREGTLAPTRPLMTGLWC